jgi:BASS family bile acid:Na+ symporter
VLIVAVQYRSLLAIRPIGFLGMLALVLAALAAGWMLGRQGGGDGKALAITTAVRNVGVGLVIATGSFPNSPAVTATLAFGLFQIVVMALVALGWGRLAPSDGTISRA